MTHPVSPRSAAEPAAAAPATERTRAGRLGSRRSDSGAGPVTVFLVLGVLALVFAAGFTALGAVAGDESSTAQHAADAAALAGAQQVLDDLPDSVRPGFRQPDEIVGLLGGGRCAQAGRAAASRLAAANGASLTRYCWNVFGDTVSVSVTLDSTNVSGAPASADAEAATTFEATGCRFPDGFVAPTRPPTSPPSPGDEPPPPPPPGQPFSTTVDCGFGPVAVRYYPVPERFRFDDLGAALDDQRPRLTE